MAYRVSIKGGKGINKYSSVSVPLETKEKVSTHVRQHPFGNAKTLIDVENLETGKVETNRKRHFYNPDLWDI